MKRIITLTVSALLLFSLFACAAETVSENPSPESAGMPEPFYPIQGGGVELLPFYLITKDGEGVLALNDISYDTFVGDEDVMAWFNEERAKGYLNTPQTSISEYPNMYSFIKRFDVPIEKIREYYEELLRLSYEVRIHCLPQEGIDVLCTLDEAKILEYFISDYAIYTGGDKAYPPSWIYYHTAEDYEEAGITPEMVEEKLDSYGYFPFTDEAADAFEEKLSEFIGESVTLERR